MQSAILLLFKIAGPLDCQSRKWNFSRLALRQKRQEELIEQAFRVLERERPYRMIFEAPVWVR
jgi:hypothetical protein